MLSCSIINPALPNLLIFFFFLTSTSSSWFYFHISACQTGSHTWNYTSQLQYYFLKHLLLTFAVWQGTWWVQFTSACILMFTERFVELNYTKKSFILTLVIDFCVVHKNIEYVRLYLTCQMHGKIPLCVRIQLFFPNIFLRVINYSCMLTTAKSISCLFTCLVVNWK